MNIKMRRKTIRHLGAVGFLLWGCGMVTESLAGSQPALRDHSYGRDGYDCARAGAWEHGCSSSLIRARWDEDSDRGGHHGAKRQRVYCESRDYQKEFCPADTDGGVRLIDQTSRKDCVEGRTWGWSRRGIWVDRGCAGEFEVLGGRPSGGGGWHEGGGHGRPELVRQVRECESVNYRHHFCEIGRLESARLRRQTSDSDCREGRTWGWDRRGIWVDRGCAGEFVVEVWR